MAINFDKALGIHPQALQVLGKRTEILSANLANADTPGFKARDINFADALKQAATSGPDDIKRTHAGHMSTGVGAGGEPTLMYRTPNQPSLDGNTVDLEQERAAFAENSVRYQASVTFLERRFRGLLTAIRGD